MSSRARTAGRPGPTARATCPTPRWTTSCSTMASSSSRRTSASSCPRTTASPGATSAPTSRTWWSTSSRSTPTASSSPRLMAAASGRSPLRSTHMRPLPWQRPHSSSGDEAVTQGADALDLGLDHVARLQELGRSASKAHPVRRACGDDRPRRDRHALRDPFDDRVDGVDHVPGAAVLLRLPVDAKPQPKRRRVELVAGDDPRPRRAEPVQALALEVLPAPAELDVAGADVVDHDVTEDVLGRALARDVDPGASDHDPELDLPVDLGRHRAVDDDVVVRARDASDRLREDGRRVDGLAHGARALLGVGLVVAADGDA